MITKLIRILDCMVEDELKLAQKDHGEKFHSNHEAIAVTFEEIQEAQDEFEIVLEEIKNLWRCMKYDWAVPNDVLDRINTHAINGAAELIQVAAMARKWKESGLK